MGEIKRLCWCLEGMSKHMLWMSVCSKGSLKGKEEEERKNQENTKKGSETEKKTEGEVPLLRGKVHFSIKTHFVNARTSVYVTEHPETPAGSSVGTLTCKNTYSMC